MVPQKSSSKEDVLNIIGSHAAQNISLRMTKTYRGMMLYRDVKVHAVDSYRAIFQIFDSTICPALEGRVHLHSPAFPRPVSARVVDLSISQGMFALSDFSYTENDWTERKHERVRPHDPVYVSLHCGRENLRASLQTISIDGIGLLACERGKPREKIYPNSLVKLDFQITSNYAWESLKGVIVYMHKIQDSISRCGVRLHPNDQQSGLLERYIYLRKREIMDELDQAFINATSPLGAECQYF